ncbi:MULTISPECIES: MFS transporter [Bacillaceae]|uniref:MFS transporter n=2 Tax=Bacillales TaxID=1385 RepID=UPI000A2ACB63|nr:MULTISPECIES: MFS transporter [unclassified Bacillus (in: firmicutes)]PGY07989.1 MFS transporter [Bacillus sp. AFS031507]SMQ81104.1 MFS transporter, YNFM family, putative membrane transport protein [Bacillus sp. OV166]
MGYIQRGTHTFKMVNIALFAGGFNTFAILWGTQPLLPEIGKEFHISPAVSSLSLSSTTIALAISMLIAGSLSEVFGRKPVMTISLFASSILSILTAFSPSFHLLILCRILQGISLAGLPAVAMAYLGEEIEPKSLGMAMGLYISGNSIGGMGGRIISGILTDHFNWHVALAVIGMISLIASLIFWFILPKSTHFKPRKFEIKKLVTSLFVQFKEPGLLYLFFTGFLLMGCFVSLYNYIGFQLIVPPYSLSQTLVGFIFIVYIVGTFSSTWMGMLADQYGKRKLLLMSLFIVLLGACITLNSSLWLKIIGIAIFTYGFFAGHSIASGWVGQLATHDKAQAASLYLFFYYAGSSIGGTASGTFYSSFGWLGVVSMIVVLAIISIIISIRLGTISTRRIQHSPHRL